MALDRAVTLRSDVVLVASRLEDPDSSAVAASAEGVLVEQSGERLARRPLTLEVLAAREPILLGLDGGRAVFAVDLDALGAPAAARFAQDAAVIGLREAGALLPEAEGGLAAYVAQLVGWHRRHRFCANCGSRTVVEEAGYSRRCPKCGTVHFPRTDPVVIMSVEHDDMLLLGRRAGWPAQRYSVLAGFVAPGESAEEAVVREVREESGIDVYDPMFVTSQPWPFPSSLMLGFAARSDGGQPSVGDGELEDVRWFTREDVRAAARERGGELLLPPRISIARFLIERWIER
jgi:NAD+ diphosphatase